MSSERHTAFAFPAAAGTHLPTPEGWKTGRLNRPWCEIAQAEIEDVRIKQETKGKLIHCCDCVSFYTVHAQKTGHRQILHVHFSGSG